MNYKLLAESVKKDNVIDMAITFTSMIRLFEKGSKKIISDLLHNAFNNLHSITTEEEYDRIHTEFCKIFSKRIYTAEKRLKNGVIKPSQKASYGQAAKVLDISVKVYIHYCNFPNITQAEVIRPNLKGAIDTPILKYLVTKYGRNGITATTIESITKPQYQQLQNLIQQDISERFNDSIFPVEFDDIVWNELNR